MHSDPWSGCHLLGLVLASLDAWVDTFHCFPHATGFAHAGYMRGGGVVPGDESQDDGTLRRSASRYGGVGTTFVVPTVAASIDLVVQIGMEHDGSRRIREIVALPGRVEAGVVETADIFTSVDGKLVRAQGYPPHPDRFERAGYDLPALLAGTRTGMGRHQG
ncbi:MAG: hypothetical protein WKF57_04020 [Nakamurella sp.]